MTFIELPVPRVEMRWFEVQGKEITHFVVYSIHYREREGSYATQHTLRSVDVKTNEALMHFGDIREPKATTGLLDFYKNHIKLPTFKIYQNIIQQLED